MSYIISIGYFDGLHLGHQELFKAMVETARRLKLKSLIITFDERPEDVLKNIKTKKLTSDKEKEIKVFGLDEVLILPFRKIQKMTAMEFFDNLLQEKDITHFFSTAKLHFGSDRKTVENLRDYFNLRHIEVVQLDLKRVESETISSSLIRNYLEKAEVAKIKNLLGNYYSVEGKVVHGENKGRLIGFPTANILIEEDIMLPREGSYITLCAIDGQNYESMSFIGSSRLKKKQEKNKGVLFETHLIDFNRDLYGEKVQVKFLSFLRENRVFNNFEELKEALMKDKEKTIAFFKTVMI